MCGIAGLFSPNVTYETLQNMGEKLHHRGPDEKGFYQSLSVGLVHTRLSIIDLQTGRQPIFNEDESVAVISNGELYNHRELRKNLEKNGHNFSTKSDTEVLVHLYEEYGIDFLNQLNGMFAFALWDDKNEHLVLARDSIGIKPLYLANDGHNIAFASELPSLLESNVEHGGIDDTSVSLYFSLGYIPAPRTIFKNFSKLRPGEYIVIDTNGIYRSRFYRPSISLRDVSFAEAAAGLRTRVEMAINKRLMSDVSLGAFLSGGIDSSIVVGTMADLMDKPVQTYTVGFEESMFDESSSARRVAEYFGTNHTEFTVDYDDVRSVIPELTDRLGEPFADPSLLPSYVVARETSRDVKVALSGDGADELFAGYSRYRGEHYSQYYLKLPRRVRQNVAEPLVDRLKFSRKNRRGELNRKVKKFVQSGVPNTANRHFEWARISNIDGEPVVMNSDPAHAGRKCFGEQHAAYSNFLPTERQDPMAKIQVVDTMFGLPNQILHKMDLASMYNSLEVRVPFLDTEVVEYAMSLPTKYKITRKYQKQVLKEAFADVLPGDILEREKQGFDMPIGEWFKYELEEDFREMIAGIETELIDNTGVLNLHHEFKRGYDDHEKFLWAVYIFSNWYDKMVRDDVLK